MNQHNLRRYFDLSPVQDSWFKILGMEASQPSRDIFSCCQAYKITEGLCRIYRWNDEKNGKTKIKRSLRAERAQIYKAEEGARSWVELIVASRLQLQEHCQHLSKRRS